MGSLSLRRRDGDIRAESTFAWCGVLVAFAMVSMFWGLDSGPRLSDHEAIVAQTATQIRQSGTWLIPQFNNVPSIRKPPLQPWLVALSSYVLDPPGAHPRVSELAARFPSAMSGVLTVLVVAGLGRVMFRPRIGLVAGGIMACCGGTLFYSHNAQAEMLLTLFMTASLACFFVGSSRAHARRRYLGGAYVCLALAMLAKAPLPLALVGLTLAVYWLVTLPAAETRAPEGGWLGWIAAFGHRVADQLKRLGLLWPVPGAVLLACIFLPWPVYVYLRVDGALPLWRTEFVDRYTGRLDDTVKHFWYYLPLLFALTVPFCLSVPEALAAPFRRVFRRERNGLLFAFTWVVVCVGFLSTSAFKRPHYLLPALPALCLLLAPVIDRLFLRRTRVDRRREGAAIGLVLALVATGLLVGGHFTAREQPQIAWAIWPVVLAVLIGTGLTSWLYWARWRREGLLALFVLSLVVFAWLWSALGRSGFEGETVAFAERLKGLPIAKDTEITWAVGRPDARVCYYSGRTITPLYTPLEMAMRRCDRLTVPQDLLVEGAKRIAGRLESNVPQYFIFEADKLEMLGSLVIDDRSIKDSYTEVLRVEVDPDDPGEALVVITNRWNTHPVAGRTGAETPAGRECSVDGEGRGAPSGPSTTGARHDTTG